MDIVFVSKLNPLLDAIAERMDLYVPKKVGEHFVYDKYDPQIPVEFNNIRCCTPIKEFLFPLRELAALLPQNFEPEQPKPFAVFGLKDCDLRAIEILDKVFLEEEFRDPFYAVRRENLFVIASDCTDPAESCFCTILAGKPYPEKGFDLNVSAVKDGFIIEAGSQRGRRFLSDYAQRFGDVPDTLVAERDSNRAQAEKQLQQAAASLAFDRPLNEILEASQDSELFDIEARGCVECQACTRVCPTCHCFYLYDTKQKQYFAKMKMWDSCMRMAYAEVAGGANPRKALGDRIKHRLMHKFCYFLERYGINMCVGCGRCIDAEAGQLDIRQLLKKLNEELQDKAQAKLTK